MARFIDTDLMRSAELEKLAAAIAALAEARVELARIAEAKSRTPAPWTITNKIDAAQEALEAARANEPALLVDQLLGDSECPPGAAVEAAERVLHDAEHERERARNIHALLDSRERIAQETVERHERGVTVARDAVLATSEEVLRLLDSYAEAKRRIAELAASLHHVGLLGIPYARRHYDAVQQYHADDMPDAARWRDAVVQLLSDADAKLPGV